MKKDIFNFRRFGKYFVSDIRSCTANYGLSLLTLSLLSLLALYTAHILLFWLISHSWNGPDMGLRAFTFILVLFCTIVTMPVKCYGGLTEKKYGSFWLMVPASKVEKFASMTLICTIAPVAAAVLYLGLDALICAADSTCGNSLTYGIINRARTLGELVGEEIDFSLHPDIANFINQIKSPWMYIDDCFGMILPFMLGAIVFKKGKTVKTFLAIALFSTAVSIICTPIMIEWGKVAFETDSVGRMMTIDESTLFNTWFFRNIALVDTISDTLTNCALLAGIYFRIKTLKH